MKAISVDAQYFATNIKDSEIQHYVQLKLRRMSDIVTLGITSYF